MRSKGGCSVTCVRSRLVLESDRLRRWVFFWLPLFCCVSLTCLSSDEVELWTKAVPICSLELAFFFFKFCDLGCRL